LARATFVLLWLAVRKIVFYKARAIGRQKLQSFVKQGLRFLISAWRHSPERQLLREWANAATAAEFMNSA
jgi:hypothetical protein